MDKSKKKIVYLMQMILNTCKSCNKEIAMLSKILKEHLKI